MNAYTKIKNADLASCDGRRCRLHIAALYPMPYRFATVWPRYDRKSGFVVHRYEGGTFGDYAESIMTNSLRRARVIAKRFVEGRA